jgi:hypothetical protein
MGELWNRRNFRYVDGRLRMGGVATLGEALDHGWKVRAFCDFGKRHRMKSVRECIWRRELS